jgi:hypothetical protein
MTKEVVERGKLIIAALVILSILLCQCISDRRCKVSLTLRLTADIIGSCYKITAAITAVELVDLDR